MPIFTAAATALLAGTALATSTVAITLVATGLSLATSIGVSYIAKALAGDPKGESPNKAVAGVQGTLQAGADVPRSFNFGYSVTAGSLVYANTWGTIAPGGQSTPNAYLSQVIALADLPGGSLVQVWVNGELVTLEGFPDDDGRGYPVGEYRKDGQPYLWVKYYDGTQTTADPLLVNTVASVDRPYESTRVGVGVPYVIVTSLVNDTLFSGFPTFKFALSGTPLYDPTKDSTNGGDGPQRWSDRSTWGGDGDNFPVVQIYNLLRGIYLNGNWLYGLQRMTSAGLPVENWNAQIEKCRAAIDGESGSEPTYRTGGQVPVNVQPVKIIESLLSGCQGRLSEIGGFYKIHVGSPDSPTFVFTDDDILSTEEQTFSPFFGLADSVNGIAATYPSPAEGWAMKPAPPLYDEDFEEEDGDRRLLANPSLDFVPYDAQVQRLQKSALQEARRARRHDLTLGPAFWIVEPGDVGEWTSVRNGYEEKQFRVDGVVDRANLDVALNLTEVDPSDYDWDHETDFTPVTSGPVVSPRPAPQGILDWFAEAFTLVDSTGAPRRPAIRLEWDGTVPGVDGVQYEVRLQSDSSDVAKGRTDQLAAGALIISQSLVPDTTYQVRGQYIPSSPRDMLWSSWLSVTTPDIKFSLAEFDAAVTAQVTSIQDAMNDRLDFLTQQIAAVVANQDSRNWLDKKSLRSQLSARSDDALAQIDEVRTVAVDTEAAFASFSNTATAQFGSTTAFVEETATAIATYDGWGAAEYSVTLNVDGYATGFNLINGGPGTSEFVVVADKFQVQLPSYNGDDPIPVFTVGTLEGSPALGISGDLVLDGSLRATSIEAGTIDTVQLKVGGVDYLNIVDNAVSNMNGGSGSVGSALTNQVVCQCTLTTKNGKALLFATVVPAGNIGGSNLLLQVDGSTVKTQPIEGLCNDPVNLTYSQFIPWTIMEVVTGLSDASHTFRVLATATGPGLSGTIIVFNPRK